MRASPDLLERAWKLGRKMAETERRIRPDLSGSHRTSHYAAFRKLHRQRMEELPAFIEWGGRIEYLLEHFARKQRVAFADPTVWNRYSGDLTDAVQDAFWSGWEQTVHLDRLYQEHVKGLGRVAAPSPQRVEEPVPEAPLGDVSPEQIIPAVLQREEEPEFHDPAFETIRAGGSAPLSFWDAVARRVFDDLHVDDKAAFWQLPAPEAMLKSRVLPA